MRPTRCDPGHRENRGASSAFPLGCQQTVPVSNPLKKASFKRKVGRTCRVRLGIARNPRSRTRQVRPTFVNRLLAALDFMAVHTPIPIPQ